MSRISNGRRLAVAQYLIAALALLSTTGLVVCAARGDALGAVLNAIGVLWELSLIARLRNARRIEQIRSAYAHTARPLEARR